MENEIWDFLALTAISENKTIIKTTKNILPNIFTWNFQFQKKNKKIIILGSSGTGKSQFTQSLEKKLLNVAMQEATYNTNNKEITINKEKIGFIDTIGQNNSASKIQEFIKIMEDDDFVGIINLVSNGYHHIYQNYEENLVFENNKIKKSFLEDNKNTEIEELNTWLPHLKDSKAKWIITLVNKADIWQKDKDNVIKHYKDKNGDYGKVFENHFQTNYFQKTHLVLPYISIVEPFYNKIFCSLGETAKYKLQNNFINELIKLIKQ